MARKAKHDKDVLYVIKRNGGKLAAIDVALLTGINKQYVYQVLGRMVEQGKIERTGKYYSISTPTAAQTTADAIQPPKAIEKSNPVIDALKDELDYIRTTVNQLVQTGEYLKVRIKELSE